MANQNQRKKRQLLQDMVLTAIPERVPDLFPSARAMTRKFILHVGPTNSGKTHAAMQELRAAGSGIYLAPLRLLAYEQYNRLNKDGFPCNMQTGEEIIEVPGAKFESATIEMLDVDTMYDCVVIDEAQMIGDMDRGGAWSTAILGVCAKTIHVCVAPEALELVEKVIEDCGDTYEVRQHHRLTTLKYYSASNTEKVKLQSGDALIVFSRRSVHALAAELQQQGHTCSVIYGKLPYDVRHSEAEKFARGETELLVATDAIGMGMNLPIRRILFFEDEKFDGAQVRPLLSTEVKQIAGRAGRAGIYDEGYVFDFFPGNRRKRLRNMLFVDDEPVNRAVLSFPKSLLHVGDKLSEMIRAWSRIKLGDLYKRENVEETIMLCEILERITDNKDFIYKFVMIPFSVGIGDLQERWLSLAKAELKGKILQYSEICRWYPRENAGADDMQLLELSYQICDLYYHYCRIFNHPSYAEPAIAARKEISDIIRKILSDQKLSRKKCRSCGKTMPWDYRYGICESCYNRNFYSWY